MDVALFAAIRSLKAAIILGGDIKASDDPRDRNGLGWKSLEHLETGLATYPVPSYERVLAAVELWKINPRIMLIVSGGLANPEQSPRPRPAISTVMATELGLLGVPKDRIIEENQSGDTVQQLERCTDITDQYGLEDADIGILTLSYHIPRVAAILHALRYEKDMQTPSLEDVRLLSVERVLYHADTIRTLSTEDAKKWQPHFKELYEHPSIQQAIVNEAFGTAQILCGHSPRRPHPYRGLPDPLLLLEGEEE